MVLLIQKDSKLNKKVLIDTFMNQNYIDEINDKFISILITQNQKKSYPIELLYTVEYPALFFLNNLEVYICEPLRGGITPKRLKKHLLECR